MVARLCAGGPPGSPGGGHFGVIAVFLAHRPWTQMAPIWIGDIGAMHLAALVAVAVAVADPIS